MRRSTGLVDQNLDQVAATADQILEIVHRDAGLMVELERLLARDAGEHGQLLEEADLTSAAIAERLREDLRARVIATRMLQRYGYLLPKVNPDSELASEQKLILQERAQQLVRAADRMESRRDSSESEAACREAGSAEDCAGRAGNRALEIEGRPQGNAAPSQSPRWEASPDVPTVPERRTDSKVLTAEANAGSDAGELATSFDGATASDEVAGRYLDVKGAVNTQPPRSATPGAGSLAPVPNSDLSSGLDDRTVRRKAPINSGSRRAAGRYEIESLNAEGLIRKANPYAAAPSLYDLYVQAGNANRPPERFGLDIFRQRSLEDEGIPMDLPVGPDYVVGPGDSLSIDLWGGVSQRLSRTVDREGRVALPEAGPLQVSGKSLGEVQTAVQRILRTQFRDVSADVSLLKLRTVRVYVVGEVREPGAYDVSSMSTPLNALFAAGGATPRGSLRRLEHYRGQQLVEEVDAYDLLLNGVRGNLQRLENGDSLRVPPAGPSVTIEGMVRRPAIYELRDEKNLEEALTLAGGLLPAATLQHIEVQRLDAHEKRTMLSLDVEQIRDAEKTRQQLERFQVQDGDEIRIFPIAPFNQDAVYLEGHVLRPGKYSYRKGMRVTDVIASYADALPEPSRRYAEILRVNSPEHRPVVESFNLQAALEHPENAPQLEPLDTIRIFGRFELEAPPEITVSGEVQAPGRYRVAGVERVRDAVYQAGGPSPDAWMDAAQLVRSLPDGTTRVMSLSLRAALAGDPASNVEVEPRDQIVLERQPDKVKRASVYVRGEVGRPGRYPLGEGMRVSDLVRSAGGLLRSASRESAQLTHYDPAAEKAGLQSDEEQTVPLAAALAGGEGANPLLRDGDVLTVPQVGGWNDIGASVTLRGEVERPGVYGIKPGERLSSLLSRAGGLRPTAYPQATVFERVEVRDLQQQSRDDLIQRLEQEASQVGKSVTTTGSEEAALQQAAMQQRDRVLDALRKAPVSGRLVVHIREGQRNFAGSNDDVELRAGDTIDVPKRPGFVLVVGQVYNANAITFTPGKNAGWYLSRAGGATSLANKKAIFILHANGSVSSGQGGLWSGGILAAAIAPGDAIVVPEKAVLGGNRWKNALAIAQIAEAGALAAAVAIP